MRYKAGSKTASTVVEQLKKDLKEMEAKPMPSHNHAQSDIADLPAILAAKQNAITPSTHIADALTDAPTDAPTNLNGLLITVLTTQVNGTNQRQNDIDTKYNQLAAKFNLLLDRLEAGGILLAS